MNIVIIKGTYHKKGNTSALVDEFARGIKDADSKAKIETFDLLDKKVGFCTGCRTCLKNPELEIGKCPIVDDATKLFPKMLKADAIVFATPVYDFGPTALLKRFMERCLCFTYGEGFPKARNKKRKGKIGIILLSSGCPAPFNDLSLINAFARFVLSFFLGALGCKKTYTLPAGAMEYGQKFKDKWLKKSYELGKKVAKKLSKK